MKEIIEKKINKLEESNKLSREFSRLLNEEDEDEKSLINSEFNQRTRREYAILVLKDLIEEIEIKEVK